MYSHQPASLACIEGLVILMVHQGQLTAELRHSWFPMPARALLLWVLGNIISLEADSRSYFGPEEYYLGTKVLLSGDEAPGMIHRSLNSTAPPAQLHKIHAAPGAQADNPGRKNGPLGG